ncbi:MAG: serine hydrolase [Planctomycetota bacterium]|jgi:CubicO group peptidase (beta-lactamase class C family)
MRTTTRPARPTAPPASIRRLAAALGLAVCAAVSGASAADTEPIVRGDLGRALDEHLSRLEGVGFSGAVAVARDDGIVLEKGYGPADRESGRPVTADTVFTIGSITKQFTAAAIMTLQMRGALAVEDRITDYFDDVPPDKRSITIHQLLTHTAGFPPAIGDDFDTSATRDRFLREALSVELRFPPGEGYEYSNVGYSLLGIIVELVSGEPYEHYLRTHLFTPAGMTRTGYLLPEYEEAELAVGYRDGERWGTFRGRPKLADGPSWHLRANGGLHSTVGDMMRWDRALRGETILSADAKARMFAPHADEGGGQSFYGYGWAIFRTPWDTSLIAHNGGNGIFSADFRRYVDDGFVIYAVTSTASFAPVDIVTGALADIVTGRPVPAPPATVTLPPDRLADLAGTYELPGGGALEVAADGRALTVRAVGTAAADALAGRLSPDDPLVKGVAERTDAIIRRWLEDDLEPLLAAWGGRMGPEELAAAARDVRSMREERLGPCRDAAIVGCEADSDGRVEAIILLRHERGPAGMRFEWRDGRLVGIALEPARRRDGETRVRMFAVDSSRFTSFDLRSGRRIEVRFEPANGTVALTSAGRTVTASRGD